jgi:hypothetical protein
VLVRLDHNCQPDRKRESRHYVSGPAAAQQKHSIPCAPEKPRREKKPLRNTIKWTDVSPEIPMSV